MYCTVVGHAHLRHQCIANTARIIILIQRMQHVLSGCQLREHTLCVIIQADEPLATFMDYCTYGHMIDNVVLLVTGTLHERDVTVSPCSSQTIISPHPLTLCVFLFPCLPEDHTLATKHQHYSSFRHHSS